MKYVSEIILQPDEYFGILSPKIQSEKESLTKVVKTFVYFVFILFSIFNQSVDKILQTKPFIDFEKNKFDVEIDSWLCFRN